MVLQAIHEKLVEVPGRAWIVPHNYFCRSGWSGKFTSSTGTSLANPKKLRVILDILTRHGFIKRELVKVPGHRWKQNKYTLGDQPAEISVHRGMVEAKKEQVAKKKQDYFQLRQDCGLQRQMKVDHLVRGKGKGQRKKKDQGKDDHRGNG